MISTFSAFFDSNVFFKARLRSLILWIAQAGLFRARWSEKVHQEWMNAVIQRAQSQNKSITVQSLEATRDAMNEAVWDCLVDQYEPLISTLDLPDLDDCHILAAAIKARADVIVTFNLKHFPIETLSQFNIHAKHPDEFLLDVENIDTGAFLEEVEADWKHYRQPPLTFNDYLESLKNAGVPMLAERLNQVRILFDQ
jgi:predicted nucleic acid-binding protein